MGIRYRTAMSMIRMQRLQAETKEARCSDKAPPRSVRRVFFSHIDPAGTPSPQVFGAALHQAQDQETSLRLLQRLRQALQPISVEQCQTSKEYECIQDELLRLSRHLDQQRSQTKPPLWDEPQTAYPVVTEQCPDSLPYRTIRIVTDAKLAIERLDLTPTDLSQYRQALPLEPALPRHLTLVSASQDAKPEAQELLMDHLTQLSDATAKLTQQSLKEPKSSTTQRSIRPELALSLLDD